MLGEMIGETTGKRIVRRVVSTDPMRVEVSFEDSGIYGEGEGAFMTQDGELVSWKGSGLGSFKEKGAVSYRGILYHRTASQKLARLNTVAAVFEYEVDPEGKTHAKFWEWK